MAAITQPLNLGDLIKFEASHLYSRDRITVDAGQNLPLGTVVGQITASGHYAQLDPSATDGRQVAAGVLLQACDATLIDRDDALIVARHAICASHALTWPDGITAAETLAALAQLKALGVLVRQGA